ncbi:MAG TPA: hypothetical protein VGM90_25910 [Kofleriaceae bacterium]
MSDTGLLLFGVFTLALGYGSFVIRAPSRFAPVLAQIALAGGIAAAVKSRLFVIQAFAAVGDVAPGEKATALANGIARGMTWVLVAFGALVLAAVILIVTRVRNGNSDDTVPPARVVG